MSDSAVRKLSFKVSPSVGEVSALLLRPRTARVLLVLGHGAGAGMEHRFMTGMAKALADAEVATFRYQFPYLEAGRRRPDRPPRLISTVRAAVCAAAELEADLPLFAGGKSLGGRMTSTAQAEVPLTGVRGIVFFGFPLHRPGDPSDARADHLRRIDLPLLFLQGTRDRLAELDRMRRAVARLGALARLELVTDADHGFDVLKRTGMTPGEVYAGMAQSVALWTRRILS